MPSGQERVAIVSDDGNKKVTIETRGSINTLATEIIDANGNHITDFVKGDYTVLTTEDSDGLMEYIGWADPGTSETSPDWKIAKLSYSTNGNPSLRWADGVSTYTKTWSNRAAYAYS